MKFMHDLTNIRLIGSTLNSKLIVRRRSASPSSWQQGDPVPYFCPGDRRRDGVRARYSNMTPQWTGFRKFAREAGSGEDRRPVDLGRLEVSSNARSRPFIKHGLLKPCSTTRRHTCI